MRLYIVCHPDADASIKSKCDFEFQYFSNGNDGFKLVKGSQSSYTVVDVIGRLARRSWHNGWEVCGISNGTQNRTLVKKDGVEGNTDWNSSRGTNADDCDWEVKDNEDWSDLGVHTWNGSSNGGGTGGGGSVVAVLEAAVRRWRRAAPVVVYYSRSVRQSYIFQNMQM